MRVAIISDIHDNIPKLRTALSSVSDCDILICCGDLCSPFIVKELGTGFSGDIHIVFGNNDGDRFRIAAAATKYPHMTVHGEYCALGIGGRQFAINHFDNIGRTMAESSAFDVVCFGHNHQFEVSQMSDTLVINPGEIYGMLTGSSTCVIYDTDTGDAQRVDVSD